MSYPPPPMPVSPLGYDMAGGMQRGRPGIITAVGVMSIVVACLSGIFSLIGVFYAFGMFMVSKLPVPVPTTTPTPGAMIAPTTVTSAAGGGSGSAASGGGGDDGSATPASGVVTIAGLEVTAAESDDGLNEEQRQVVITTLTRMSGMSEARQKHLDLLLSVAGRRVMPAASSPAITMQKIRANVTDAGVLPSVRGDGSGPTYFLVGTGRMECYDDHAVFRPDGSADIVSASTTAASSDDGTASGPGSTSPAPPGRGVRRRSGAGGAAPAFKLMSFKVNPLAAVLSVLGEVASIALAIYLLVIGILVLRDVRAARTLHWWYVFLKIPVVIVTAIAWWVVARDMTRSISAFFATNPLPGMPPATPMPFGAAGAAAAMWLTVAAVIALAYPIALACVLLSRTAREYYGSIRY